MGCKTRITDNNRRKYCIVSYIGGKFSSGELVMLRKNSCCHGVLKNHAECGNCEINE